MPNGGFRSIAPHLATPCALTSRSEQSRQCVALAIPWLHPTGGRIQGVESPKDCSHEPSMPAPQPGLSPIARWILLAARKAPERNPAVKLRPPVNQRARESERVGAGGARATVGVALGPRDSVSRPRARRTTPTRPSDGRKPSSSRDFALPGPPPAAGVPRRPPALTKTPPRFRDGVESSPTWTRTRNLAVNSRSLYRLSYRGYSGAARSDPRLAPAVAASRIGRPSPRLKAPARPAVPGAGSARSGPASFLAPGRWCGRSTSVAAAA